MPRKQTVTVEIETDSDQLWEVTGTVTYGSPGNRIDPPDPDEVDVTRIAEKLIPGEVKQPEVYATYEDIGVWYDRHHFAGKEIERLEDQLIDAAHEADYDGIE